jgi:hypothetical protein
VAALAATLESLQASEATQQQAQAQAQQAAALEARMATAVGALQAQQTQAQQQQTQQQQAQQQHCIVKLGTPLPSSCARNAEAAAAATPASSHAASMHQQAAAATPAHAMQSLKQYWESGGGTPLSAARLLASGSQAQVRAFSGCCMLLFVVVLPVFRGDGRGEGGRGCRRRSQSHTCPHVHACMNTRRLAPR